MIKIIKYGLGRKLFRPDLKMYVNSNDILALVKAKTPFVVTSYPGYKDVTLEVTVGAIYHRHRANDAITRAILEAYLKEAA